MSKPCTHLDQINPEAKATNPNVCEDCVKTGDIWVSLRMCLTCGHVGCCDSSKNTHARKHFEETGHPIIEALPNKEWRWCYIDNEYIN
jgi:uncharacterized UBP type Zn finger protein